jgi:HPt (histidine-containing phosphotransfer) domain-containing protein
MTDAHNPQAGHASAGGGERAAAQSSGPLDQSALTALLDMVGGDGGFLTEMIDTFLTEAPALIAEMESAVAAKDAQTLRRAAHTLKSNSRTFGALHLGDLCQQIEERAAAAQLEGLPDLIRAAAAELATVAPALRGERKAS